MANVLLTYNKKGECIVANNFYDYMLFDECINWAEKNCTDKDMTYVVYNLDGGKTYKIER